ncbi:hypothetical protein C1I98_14820 [Spongiactinospora gelatinilytica]|uniref:YtkA-like domain-containing protein n=1 Tax=Spongiactinospora gelatinilytica TaxID=2666298 RepID=A0A2W2GCP8_9ACTN|nr:hypothetical protein [Spongiactinospora gelatinilytica]PZG46201.1 hypothetical protein C1I98_14820 [Spongiactinospora gelatinilytica]
MRKALIAAALVAVAVTIFVLGRSGGEPVRVTTTGTHYGVTVVIDKTAERDFTVEILLNSGDADAVTFSAVMPTMGHAMPEVTARKPGPGRFLAQGDLFSMTGVWQLSIRVTGRAGEETLGASALISG